MIATAPGKLILTGEYAVLDGAPALVIAIDRRAIARRDVPPATAPSRSPVLAAVADELARRGHAAAARAALEIVVDSSALHDGPCKLGLGSSAAVAVAATALALGVVDPRTAPAARDRVLEIALAAHAAAQAPRGARGSGADVAAAVHGGTIVFTRGQVEHRRWPATVTLLPFFTGRAADTPALVAEVNRARAANPVAVDAALRAITDASRAACAAVAAPAERAGAAVIEAFALAAAAIDRLAEATGVELVPRCVIAARSALAGLGGTAKTTGAGGGDVAIGVIPATIDATAATRAIIDAGGQPLQLALDETGVDTRPASL